MAARNREGFRSIISYGDVLDGNGRGRGASPPRFSTVAREKEEEEEEVWWAAVEERSKGCSEGSEEGMGGIGVDGWRFISRRWRDLTARRDVKSGERQRGGKFRIGRRSLCGAAKGCSVGWHAILGVDDRSRVIINRFSRGKAGVWGRRGNTWRKRMGEELMELFGMIKWGLDGYFDGTSRVVAYLLKSCTYSKLLRMKYL